MHDDEVPIDLAIARSLVREQFPEWNGLSIVAVAAGGTVNSIFRIGSDLAARFPRRSMEPSAVETVLRAEAAAMTELSLHCPFPTPVPVAIGESSPSFPMPWSIQTWLRGEEATPSGLASSAVFARDLATLIASLRAVDTRGRRFSGGGRGGDLTDHDEWMSVCFDNSRDLLDVPRLRSLWASFRELPDAGRDVMSHCDLIPANLLVSGDRLVGVLDGGGFSAADPALDLVAAWHLLDRQARELLQETLGIGSVEWYRGAAWAFAQSMGLVWYYESSNPGMNALGRSTLRRILEDPDIRRLG